MFTDTTQFQDANGRYSHVPLKKANDAIGVTTDELVEQKIQRR